MNPRTKINIGEGMKFFDAHTHAHFAAFKNDWREVIQRALDNNVWLINVGTQKDTSAKAIEVAHQFKEGVYATVGLHPIHTGKSFHDAQELGTFSHSQEYENVGFTSRGEVFDPAVYEQMARDSRVVAIGECGLDYYRMEQSANREEQIEKQKEVFIQQIELAKKVQKPLMIHCRAAFDDLIQLLTTNYQLLTTPPGAIHFFTGTTGDARRLLEIGFSFTFGGVITFSRDYDEVIKTIPLDRILSETDAPYVAPAPYRGKRNEPAYVVEVVKKLAELKQVSTEEIAERIWKNAQSLFTL